MVLIIPCSGCFGDVFKRSSLQIEKSNSNWKIDRCHTLKFSPWKRNLPQKRVNQKYRRKFARKNYTASFSSKMGRLSADEEACLAFALQELILPPPI